MATNREDIINKFKDGMIPPEGDFQEIFDNFVHKDDDKATPEMVDAGIDDEHYVTPALLRLGLQNIGAIAGGGNLPYKQHTDSFNGTFIILDKLPIVSSVKVFKNGQLLLEGETGDYTIDYETATVLFSESVEDRNIEIDYWYKSTEPLPGSVDGNDITIIPKKGMIVFKRGITTPNTLEPTDIVQKIIGYKKIEGIYLGGAVDDEDSYDILRTDDLTPEQTLLPLINLTFSDLTNFTNTFGITNVSDINQWNNYFDSLNSSQFDAVVINGNNVILAIDSPTDMGDIILLDFSNMELTNIGFHPSIHLGILENNIQELILNGNQLFEIPNLNGFDNLANIVLYGNEIDDSFWTTELDWISYLPNNGTIQPNANIQGTQAETLLNQKNWIINYNNLPIDDRAITRALFVTESESYLEYDILTQNETINPFSDGSQILLITIENWENILGGSPNLPKGDEIKVKIDGIEYLAKDVFNDNHWESDLKIYFFNNLKPEYFGEKIWFITNQIINSQEN